MIYLVIEKSKEGNEKEKKKKKRAGILETPIWKARMYLQVCDFLEIEG